LVAMVYTRNAVEGSKKRVSCGAILEKTTLAMDDFPDLRKKPTG